MTYYSPRPVIIGSRLVSFSTGVFVGSLFTGWDGWNGWGWRPNWFDRTVVVNNNFFYRYGYRAVRSGGHRLGGLETWQHEPVHRWSVPYSNHLVETRFRNSVRTTQASRPPTVVRSAAAALPPRPEPAPNVSRSVARAFAPAAPATPVPGVSQSVPNSAARYNNRSEPSQIAAPNAFQQKGGFSGNFTRSSRQPVQTFRSSPRPAPQRSPAHSRGKAQRNHGTGERSAGHGNWRG